MTKFYATTDTDGCKALSHASIAAFDTEAEARAYLLQGYAAADFSLATAEFGEVDFGDCWIRYHTHAPQAGETSYAPFSFEQLQIQEPGSHPGGNEYWVMPAPSVICLAGIDEATNG